MKVTAEKVSSGVVNGFHFHVLGWLMFLLDVSVVDVGNKSCDADQDRV
jgi:hypothetical protein